MRVQISYSLAEYRPGCKKPRVGVSCRYVSEPVAVLRGCLRLTAVAERGFSVALAFCDDVLEFHVCLRKKKVPAVSSAFLFSTLKTPPTPSSFCHFLIVLLLLRPLPLPSLPQNIAVMVSATNGVGPRGSKTFLFTSESVGEGHPDKMADQVSDAILDACLKDDPFSRVACESALKTGMVMVFGG